MEYDLKYINDKENTLIEDTRFGEILCENVGKNQALFFGREINKKNKEVVFLLKPRIEDIIILENNQIKIEENKEEKYIPMIGGIIHKIVDKKLIDAGSLRILKNNSKYKMIGEWFGEKKNNYKQKLNKGKNLKWEKE